MVEDSSTQRITRLTPLAAAISRIETQIGAVAPQKSSVAAALGSVLAEDVVVARPVPAMAIALCDGYAVDAAAFADAGPYAPVALPVAVRRVDSGDTLPGGCDAVLSVDAIVLRGGRLEAVAPLTPGAGVLTAGDDATPRTPLRLAGERLRAHDIAVIAAAGIDGVAIRTPRLHIESAGSGAPLIEAARAMLARLVAAAGGAVVKDADTLEAALVDQNADMVIAIGGTGRGRNDGSVQALARLGRVEAYGIALSPGETAAVGFVGTRPVLLIPGRLDAALAVWLLIGRYLVARLAAGKVEDAPVLRPLKRKVTSTIGMTELIPVRAVGDMAEPLAAGYLSLESLARSDGWIVVPADSEGFMEGTPVAVRAWP
jgi:molybdopterin molybdotransferase